MNHDNCEVTPYYGTYLYYLNFKELFFVSRCKVMCKVRALFAY